MFRTSLLLTLFLAGRSCHALQVGDELCIQGFIMDYFCIKNVRMIDNGLLTLEEPDRHTVHCLVDVGVCLDSAFEVLVDSNSISTSSVVSAASTAYTRGYRLDDDSKNDMIGLARSVGSCSTCDTKYNDNSKLSTGFKAVMKVTVLDLSPDDGQNAPPLVRVNARKDASRLGSDPCQSEYGMAEGVPAASPTNPPTPPPTNPPTPPPTLFPTPPPTNPPTPPPTLFSTPPPTNPPTPPPTLFPTPPPSPPPTMAANPPTSPPTLPTMVEETTPPTTNDFNTSTTSPTMMAAPPTPPPSTMGSNSTSSPTASTPTTAAPIGNTTLAPTTANNTEVPVPPPTAPPSPNATVGNAEELDSASDGVHLFWSAMIMTISSIFAFAAL